MSFNTAPATAETESEFTLAAGEKITLTLYKADGSGLIPGAVGLIQQEVDTDVWQTQDAISSTRPAILWEAEGSWRVLKIASVEAVGVRGDGGS